jgi:PAS domain S-box-containing protein
LTTHDPSERDPDGRSSKRRQAEEALRETAERLSMALAIGGAGIWEWNIETDEVSFDEGFHALLGYTYGELPTALEEWLLYHHPEDVPVWMPKAEAYLRGDSPAYESEHRIRTKAGAWNWVFTRGKIVKRDATGSPLLFMGVAMNVTERKQTEEALLESEHRLRQSQKMEAVGQLAGGIAHDFNNLLTTILGYSDLLLARADITDSSAEEELREIKHAAERAGALTKQILAFSRRQTLRPRVVALNEILNGIEPMLRRTLGEHIDLASLLHPDLGLVEVDVHQFEQVLLNLALNARDAMPTGGHLTLKTANVELDRESCRTHPGTTPGSYVMLAVSDTGIGMDEHTLEHVFEPFFTTKGVGEGTGLGLATVYGIVKQSKGFVFVYSEPGKGTVFEIYLPRVIEDVAPGKDIFAERKPSLANETVMLVEDEAPLRNLIERVLGEAGYTVVSFGSADEAMAVLAQGQDAVDLLLTDIVLPGIRQCNDMVDALKLLRPDVPVLFMSGYPRDAIVHAGRLDEGVNFIEKPFTTEALVSMVRQVLSHRVAGFA